ncbi:hypothetical protein Pint_03654 [Pistacia integerrima]|uniref:Uncharacterized protein n=1 Tax=Pistacia integerrima TaxID=434235 RepID=A0ACC0ZAC9_9ROSI|nr:hypothetical protein Pint_03654 [Pistacia integerrima]
MSGCACVAGNDDITDVESLRFDLGTIEAAAKNFSTDNKLGEGGFGEVYKAWKHWRDGTPLQLLDSTLTDSYSRNEVIRCIHMGLLCVQEDPADRATMATIVFMLDSYSVILPAPQQPAFFLGSRMEASMPTMEFDFDKSKSKSIPSSVDDASITEVYPR